MLWNIHDFYHYRSMKNLWMFLLVVCAENLCAQTTFLLFRHGETDWNVQHRVQTLSDNPLNAKGVLQAIELSEKICTEHKDIKAIYSSDLQRAAVTAQITADKLQLNVIQRRDLREMECYESEGLTFQEVTERYGERERALHEKYPNRQERWSFNAVPGDENLNHLVHRFQKALEEIAWQHPNEKVAIFAHGLVIAAFIAHSLDRPTFPYLTGTQEITWVPNCSAALFSYDNVFEFLGVE